MSDTRETPQTGEYRLAPDAAVYIRADELRAWLKEWRARDDHNGTGLALASGLVQFLKASLAPPAADVQPPAADVQPDAADTDPTPPGPSGNLDFSEETDG